jgi:hypothetical protein
MNDKTAVFVRSFPVGKHTVTMILTRRRFLAGRITCRWSPLSRLGSLRKKGASCAVVARLLLPMPMVPSAVSA